MVEIKKQHLYLEFALFGGSYNIYTLAIVGKYQEDIKRDLLLSRDCSEKLVFASSVIEGRCEALNSGGITVTKLRELVKYEDKFVPVVDLVKNQNFNGKMVTKLIKLRTREIAEIERKAKKVTVLTSCCHYLSNGKSCLQHILATILLLKVKKKPTQFCGH